MCPRCGNEDSIYVHKNFYICETCDWKISFINLEEPFDYQKEAIFNSKDDVVSDKGMLELYEIPTLPRIINEEMLVEWNGMDSPTDCAHFLLGEFG